MAVGNRITGPSKAAKPAAVRGAEGDLDETNQLREQPPSTGPSELRQNEQLLPDFPQDVTFRNEVEEALQEQAALLNLAHDAIIVRGTGDTITFWNSGAEETYGWTRAEALGQVSHVLLQTRFPSSLTELSAELAEQGQWQGELTHIRKDGREIVVTSRWAVQRNRDGVQTGVLEINRDITDGNRARRALRESEATLRAFCESAPLMIGVVEVPADNSDIIHIYDNPATDRFFARSRGSTVGQSALTMGLPPQAVSRWIEQYRLAEREGQPVRFDYAHPQDKGALWLSAVVAKIGPGFSGRTRFSYAVTDVTERRRAAEALRESEERFSGAFKNAAIGMALVDLDGRWLQVNRALCEHLGYSEHELLARTFQDITHPDDLATDLGFMQQLLSGAIQSYQMEKRYYHKAGHVVWGLLCVSLVRNDQRQPAYFVGQIQDITERKRAQEALQQSNERFQQFAEKIQEVFWMADPTIQQSLYVSPAYERIWGRTCASLYENPKSFLESIHPDDLPRVLRMLTVERADKGFSHEYRIIRPDGCVRWISDSGFPVTNKDGQLTHYIGVARDITEQNEAQLALHESREQLRGLLARFQRLREEERTRMAREVHDVLGQMLTGLKMDMAWWERRFTKLTDPALRRALEEKVAATSRLADTMIETVQKISRELRPSLLDNIGLGAALQFEARQFQARTGILCEVVIPEDALPVEAEIATGIFRVFQELLTNVARHAQANRVRVELRQTEQHIALSVEDNGRGIRQTELNDLKSLGLVGMIERAWLMGGHLNIVGRTGAGTGTFAVLSVPIKSR